MDAIHRADSPLEMLTVLLDLDGFEVVEAAQDRGRKARRLTVVPTDAAGLCPHCRRATDDRHAWHDREVLDLPLGGWRTELVVRGWQFRCGDCRRFFTPRHPALAEGAHATERLLERLAELATHADASSAARFFGIPERTADRWYHDHLERRQRAKAAAAAAAAAAATTTTDLQPVRSLGIDEISTKKGIAASPAC